MQKDAPDFLQEPNRFVVFRQGRTVYLFDEINNATVAECFKLLQMIMCESSKKEIQIILNTCGGSVYDGFALYDYLIRLPAPLTIVGTGLVASMGVIILLAGKHRAMTKTSRLMSHQVATAVAGKVSDVKIDFNEANALEKTCVEIIANRTGQSQKVIENEIKKGDKYMSPQEALKKGYIHKVI